MKKWIYAIGVVVVLVYCCGGNSEENSSSSSAPYYNITKKKCVTCGKEFEGSGNEVECYEHVRLREQYKKLYETPRSTPVKRVYE